MLALLAAWVGLLTFLLFVIAMAIAIWAMWMLGFPVGLTAWLYLWAGITGVLWLGSRIRLGAEAVLLGRKLQCGIEPVVWSMTRSLLGDDPDSLLLPDNFDGLRSPQGRDYIVDSKPMKSLNRKVAQIEAGTIAVCGPRGAGKSTLLEKCVEQSNFGLVAHAPAAYAPHDFLLSLSVQLCEHYIRSEGYDTPSFARVSQVRRTLRLVKSKAIFLLKWLAFAIPAAGLLVLGLASTIRSAATQYTSAISAQLDQGAEWIRGPFGDIWQGNAVGASVSLVIVAAVWWRARRATWLRKLVREMWSAVALAFGFFLIIGVLTHFALDEWNIHHLKEIPFDTFVKLGFCALFWFGFTALRFTVGEFTLGRRKFTADSIFAPLAGLTGLIFLVRALRSPEIQTWLSAPENPLRITLLLVAIGMVRVSYWKPKPAEPILVTRCRNHLYRLQTTQTSSASLSAAGASHVLSIGANHATSISTVPPNFPELVADFRDLLAVIAAKFHREGGRVVIAIDEVDRLGSDAQALAFLREIKAILGVPHVHYLISVAEDVGAAFVRRGLPHRDVTDSSLDDVLYVDPATLDDSRSILDKRAPGLSEPYVILAHALSGGIPRDLIRYGRRIMEMRDRAGSDELTDISHHLIMEELSETLSGFRTLLSKQAWDPDTSEILVAFRTLGGHLRSQCSCARGSQYMALEQFAFHVLNIRPRGGMEEISHEARELIHEASTYAYFSLTLLGIFGAEGFGRRMDQATRNGPHGAPEILAEARLELAVSPHSARPLIASIRESWSLPAQPHSRRPIPQPRSGGCRIHNRV
ncbi:hypothetical protein ACFV5N_00585 [Streptomyces sp. NPDC059853]|uniref:hypothetical protein n=1 Tax=Streptomyces sp. NPDC059853 TaxID=3346973 RepID=UPI0036649876